MKGRWNSSIDISKVLSCLILYIETTFPTMWPKKSLVRSDKYWQYLLVHEIFFTGSGQALMSSPGNRLMQDIRFNNDAFTYWIYLMIDVKVNGLKINLKIGVSIQCFQRLPQQVRLCSLHCDIKCFDCNWRIPQTIYISNLAS